MSNNEVKEPTLDEILEARRELWYRGDLRWKLSPTQIRMLQEMKKNNAKVFVLNAGRRIGKCIEANVEIMTPIGPIPIKDLKVGDQVYGYNKDGSVSLTNVVAHEYQGKKEVVALQNNGRVVAESTEDHTWLTSREGYLHVQKERKVKDFYKGIGIVRRFVDRAHGNVHVPDAYALGIFLGDGYCNAPKGNRLFISSADEDVVKAVANDLNVFYRKDHPTNYTWSFKTVKEKYAKSEPIKVSYYDEWCRGRLAHEKIVNIEILRTWDKKSKLKFLAGLIDSDGSVGVYENSINISFGCQSLSIMKAVQWLCLDLFQYKPTITKENRDKYVNGPLYYLRIKNNFFGKKILKELSSYLQCDRKKWKDSYANLRENNVNPLYVGVSKGDRRIADTYDIQVDNDTNLYLTAEGLVTHNSYFLSILALEQCLQKPKSIVKFLQPEKSQVRRNITPIIEQICEDCPAEIKPKFNTQISSYVFPNGSEIQFAGTDNNNYESLRGGDAHLCLIDEAGFLSAPLNYIVRTIFVQSTMRTKGKIILSSSTPTDPNHEFVKYIQTAMAQDRFFAVTTKECLEDHEKEGNELFTREMYDTMLSEYPMGENDPEFRRECLNELVLDGTNAVIPEFTPTVQNEIVREWRMPKFCDKYVSMDIGFKDLTVALFGFYDFENAVIVVQDELVFSGPKMTTDTLAAAIKAKERELWFNPKTGEYESPYMRVSDNNLILINDLHRLHGIFFRPTNKDNKEAQINNLRLDVAGYKLYINPKCKTLIRHLKFATWDKQRKGFTRTEDGAHADAVDALLYLVRNVQKSKNPYPPGYRPDQAGSTNIFKRDSYFAKSIEDEWSKLVPKKPVRPIKRRT